MASFSVFSLPQWQKNIPCKGISLQHTFKISPQKRLPHMHWKKHKRACLMASFSVFSAPQWQKRDTLQGDFTTACWIPIIHFLSLIIGFVLIWNECMLFCNYFTTSQINQKILPQKHWKKLRRACFMVFFSVFSVPLWQKRYTLQGDFTSVC